MKSSFFKNKDLSSLYGISCTPDFGRTSGKRVLAINTPIKPHFYIVKLGFAGVYLFFLFLLQNIDCRYSLEPPRRGGSSKYPQSMF